MKLCDRIDDHLLFAYSPEWPGVMQTGTFIEPVPHFDRIYRSTGEGEKYEGPYFYNKSGKIDRVRAREINIAWIPWRDGGKEIKETWGILEPLLLKYIPETAYTEKKDLFALPGDVIKTNGKRIPLDIDEIIKHPFNFITFVWKACLNAEKPKIEIDRFKKEWSGVVLFTGINWKLAVYKNLPTNILGWWIENIDPNEKTWYIRELIQERLCHFLMKINMELNRTFKLERKQNLISNALILLEKYYQPQRFNGKEIHELDDPLVQEFYDHFPADADPRSKNVTEVEIEAITENGETATRVVPIHRVSEKPSTIKRATATPIPDQGKYLIGSVLAVGALYLLTRLIPIGGRNAAK